MLPLARSTAQVKLAINLRMSQAAGTPGRPWQDGPTAPRIATPASTQMIPAIGLKKDIAAAFNLRHHACIKASTSVKVRSARKIGLATLVPLSKNVIPPATLVYCFAVGLYSAISTLCSSTHCADCVPYTIGCSKPILLTRRNALQVPTVPQPRVQKFGKLFDTSSECIAVGGHRG